MSKANQTSETEQTPVFESSLKELEEIVIRLESGELPLEDALNEFERGIQLARQGQKTLQQAEQRVQILLNHDAQSPLDEFSSDAE
ncbi:MULTISPECIES: exodeoxyribonuclease VII small subunit [Xenorhabdus]|uniref:Exodeoxyribonuclease 7 small subunit n=2 Tax=Xenorhabdus TaxID=626 RepID=A0A0J5FVP3_9GAMM|nr:MULTISPECIES: exodeoxyribonuclease VII small subunit [Xenorhabdus]KMJ46293.1 exodeoxyribonuclease VII small subunit [Xenorhabdus khoisanae]MBC8951655.1 exodeoxyribonuclease VII small subunit [Xenorhabdus sp. PB62.4]MDC9613601.1 exodeoxyribonuclease VII small subunit [Xenorhabdus khoisanae]PHM47819.1 exodeoxyribonuclease VII small subunit [Xenorhabdus miraniensis]